MAALYKLAPYRVPKLWGGGHLDARFENKAVESIGELCLFSSLPEFPVAVCAAGKEIPLVEFWKEQMPNEKMPSFMVKLLSTCESISVQNHPSDKDVRALGLQGNGKVEAWTILDADSAARVYLGLKDVFPNTYLSTLSTLADPLSALNEITPTRGDVITIHPGIVHSTQGRLLFYEIQQMSDHTFRIHDFGRGRSLDIEKAVHCAKDQTPDLSDWQTNITTSKFCVSYHQPKSGLVALNSARWSVVTWFGHDATLSSGDTTFAVSWGDSFLIPQAEGAAITIVCKEEGAPNLPLIDMLFEAHL